MTQEEFIKVLGEKGYVYEMEGDRIVVTHNDSVDLRSIETLPPGVKFKNKGYVDLRSIETLPPGVEFKNVRDVYLNSLKTIPTGVEFKNKGYVYLKSLIDGWFGDWSGNIEGIASNRLLNHMINKGFFI